MTTKQTLPLDLLWGGQAIADYINRPLRETYYLIETGAVPAKKLGPKTIVGRKSEIDRALSCDDGIDHQTNRERPKLRRALRASSRG